MGLFSTIDWSRDVGQLIEESLTYWFDRRDHKKASQALKQYAYSPVADRWLTAWYALNGKSPQQEIANLSQVQSAIAPLLGLTSAVAPSVTSAVAPSVTSAVAPSITTAEVEQVLNGLYSSSKANPKQSPVHYNHAQRNAIQDPLKVGLAGLLASADMAKADGKTGGKTSAKSTAKQRLLQEKATSYISRVVEAVKAIEPTTKLAESTGLVAGSLGTALVTPAVTPDDMSESVTPVSAMPASTTPLPLYAVPPVGSARNTGGSEKPVSEKPEAQPLANTLTGTEICVDTGAEANIAAELLPTERSTAILAESSAEEVVPSSKPAVSATLLHADTLSGSSAAMSVPVPQAVHTAVSAQTVDVSKLATPNIATEKTGGHVLAHLVAQNQFLSNSLNRLTNQYFEQAEQEENDLLSITGFGQSL
jgi:hypothetical protein